MSLIFYLHPPRLDQPLAPQTVCTVPRRLILHFKDFHFMHQTAVLARSAVPTVPYRSRSVAYQLVLVLRHVPGPDTIYRHVPSFGTPATPEYSTGIVHCILVRVEVLV